MKRLLVVLLALALAGCTPLVVQQAGRPELGFQGPRLERDAFVSFDGARLGLTTWAATTPAPAGRTWS